MLSDVNILINFYISLLEISRKNFVLDLNCKLLDIQKYFFYISNTFVYF